jgi:hypothetical protein
MKSDLPDEGELPAESRDILIRFRRLALNTVFAKILPPQFCLSPIRHLSSLDRYRRSETK